MGEKEGGFKFEPSSGGDKGVGGKLALSGKIS